MHLGVSIAEKVKQLTLLCSQHFDICVGNQRCRSGKYQRHDQPTLKWASLLKSSGDKAKQYKLHSILCKVSHHFMSHLVNAYYQVTAQIYIISSS